jgi:L-ascorbate metabolism protein UlaG (beta-lactamase superfamily)
MQRLRLVTLAATLLFMLVSRVAVSHDNHTSSATYLGNAAILVQGEQTKLLFDPFFHKDFSIYQLVPDDIRQAIFQGTPPYNNINFVFISHAHDDHFSAIDLLNYLNRHTQVQLVAPKQAIDKLMALREFKSYEESLLPRLHAVLLGYGDMAWSKTISNTRVSAVRIPHAGWPGRAEVENLVFRVTLNDGITVMHMGDADPDDEHYLPYKLHWQQQVTDTAFPPYWFFFSAEGRDILDELINAKQHIGVHVPVEVPKRLMASKKLFFSKPGQTKKIHKH